MSAAQWALLFPSFTTALGGDVGVCRKGHQNPLRTQALISTQCSLFGVPHPEEPLLSPADPWSVGGSWRSHFPAGCSAAQTTLRHFFPRYSRARQLLITCNKAQLWSIMKWSCAAKGSVHQTSLLLFHVLKKRIYFVIGPFFSTFSIKLSLILRENPLTELISFYSLSCGPSTPFW